MGQLAVDGAEFWVAEESTLNKNFSPVTLGGCSVRMLVLCDDSAAMVDTAVAAGATVVVPVAEAYGWLIGRIVDPFGHHWEIGKRLD